jgi:hypothetical protein
MRPRRRLHEGMPTRPSILDHDDITLPMLMPQLAGVAP